MCMTYKTIDTQEQGVSYLTKQPTIRILFEKMRIAGEALSESVLFVMGKMMSKNSISQTKLGI